MTIGDVKLLIKGNVTGFISYIRFCFILTLMDTSLDVFVTVFIFY